MFKNETSISGSSTILKEHNHELYKNTTSILTLGTGANKPEHVGALDKAVTKMTVTTSSKSSDALMPNSGDNEKSQLADTGGDNGKELYQSMMDAARQLDSKTSKVTTVEGLFGKEVLDQRRKLKDLCEKLLFEEPKKYGVIARERMWRSVFYDVIGRAKRLKKTSTFTPIQQMFVKNHLLSGVGQLNVLLIKMETHPEFQWTNKLIMPNVLDIIQFDRPDETSADENHEDDKWLVDILYMCLINTGDLYRYLTDIFYKDADTYTEYFDQAQHYYSEAFLLNPVSGLAHNQLGNLSAKLNDGLDSTYYLLYSMSAGSPYDGAYPNLKQLLDGQLVRLATMPAIAELKPIDTFAHTFLGLIYHLVCTDGTHLNNFEKSCKEAIVGFYELLSSNEGNLGKELYFRVSVISILTVWRLQAVDSNYVSTAVAFASGLFLNLANYLCLILKDKCCIVPIQQAIEESTFVIEATQDSELTTTNLEKLNEIDDHEEGGSGNSETIVKVAKRRTLRGRRVRRGGAQDSFSSSEDEDESMNGRDGDSDCESRDSDLMLSDDSDSSYAADSSGEEAESDIDKEPNDAFGDDGKYIHYESASSNEYNSDGSSAKKDKKKDNPVPPEEGQMRMILKLDELQSITELVEPVIVGMLPYIKWFKSSPLIASAFMTNCGNDFMQNICDIMNILSTINWSSCGISDVEKPKQKHLFGWQKLLGEDECSAGFDEFLLELAEDRSLLGIPAFADDLKGLQRDAQVSLSDMLITRFGRVLAFGHWLTSVDGIALKYSKELREFTVEVVQKPKLYNQARRLKHLRDTFLEEPMNEAKNSRRNGQRHARSRKGFNRRHQSPARHFRRNQSDGPIKQISTDDTIYILCDLPAMLHHFDTIRRLAMYSKFCIVIPHSVHKSLDKLKDSEEDGSKEARVAASWVEEQNDCAGIRMLRRGDKRALDFEYPEPQSDAAREFLDILESCNHFRIQENKVGRPATKFFDDVRDKYRVLYLSGHLDLFKPKNRNEFNAKEIAQLAHIFVDRVTFYVENQGRTVHKRRFKGKG